MSETARQTLKGEKWVPGAFAMLERRGPQGRAHIWVVFSCKGVERGEWRGPSRCFGCGSFVEKRNRADEPVFGGV